MSITTPPGAGTGDDGWGVRFGRPGFTPADAPRPQRKADEAGAPIAGSPTGQAPGGGSPKPGRPAPSATPTPASRAKAPDSADQRWTAEIRTVVLWLITAEVVVLAVTGLWLALRYRPALRPEFGGLPGTRHDVVDLVRRLHRTTAIVTIPTAVAATVLLALQWSPTRRWIGATAGAGTVLAAFAGLITGALLPWDQVALKAVTVGTGLRGYGFLFDGSARFVLLGGAEISTGALATTFALHTVVLGLATVTFLAIAWLRHRSAGRDLRL